MTKTPLDPVEPASWPPPVVEDPPELLELLEALLELELLEVEARNPPLELDEELELAALLEPTDEGEPLAPELVPLLEPADAPEPSDEEVPLLELDPGPLAVEVEVPPGKALPVAAEVEPSPDWAPMCTWPSSEHPAATISPATSHARTPQR